MRRAFRDAHTADVHNMEELGRQVDGGYAKAMWCGDQACEDEIKDRFSASSRCMPFDQTPIGETCVCCGKPAKKVIYFAKHIDVERGCSNVQPLFSNTAVQKGETT